MLRALRGISQYTIRFHCEVNVLPVLIAAYANPWARNAEHGAPVPQSQRSRHQEKSRLGETSRLPKEAHSCRSCGSTRLGPGRTGVNANVAACCTAAFKKYI